jgi:hypothetical protein
MVYSRATYAIICYVLVTIITAFTILIYGIVTTDEYNISMNQKLINISQIRCVTTDQSSMFVTIPFNTMVHRIFPNTRNDTDQITHNYLKQDKKIYMSILNTLPYTNHVYYDVLFKDMNTCISITSNLIENYMWNHTYAYMYTGKDDKTYPFAYPHQSSSKYIYTFLSIMLSPFVVIWIIICLRHRFNLTSK